MDGKDKWNSGEPADRQGSEGSGAEQGFGATAAFGQVKPAASPGADDDLLSLLMGGEKKPAAAPPNPAPEQAQAPIPSSPIPSGPVVHQVDSGSTGHFDVLSRMRAAEMPAPTPVAPSTPAPVSPSGPASTSASASQQPQGGFTQLFQSLGSPAQNGPAQAASGQSGAGGATATFSTPPVSAPSSAPAPAPASSGGFTELFGKVSAPSSPAPAEPVFPPAAASIPPVAQPAPQPASQPGSFTQIFSSFGSGPAASSAPVPPAAPVVPTASSPAFQAVPPVPAPVPQPPAPASGGFTSLFSTAAAAEPVKEKESPISFGPESGTGAFKRSATASFSSFGGAAAASAPVPPAVAPVPASPTAPFPVASPAASSAPSPASSGGFTELFTKLPAEERERGLSGTPTPDLNSPQPSLTQMFGTQSGASQQSAPPPDPSSFTQILSRSASPMTPASAPWEPQRESGSSFSSRPEPSFATPAPVPQSDPGQNMGVTTLLRKLESPSAPPPSSAPPMATPAPSTGQEGSWTKTFETLASPSSSAPSSPGGYGQAPSGGEATRAMAMPQAPAPGLGSGSGYGAGYVSAPAPAQTSAAWQATPAAPPPVESGPSEVTRIINASKMRENLLRSGEGQGQSGAAAAPQQPGTAPGAAPGMPAMPGGVQFAGPQMNPQSLMHGGGAGMSASASMGGMSMHGSAAPPAMGGGMGHMGGGAAGGMNMPHMQMPPVQAPAMNLKSPAAPAQTGAAAGPTKFQQMIPLLLVVIIFLLVALIVTVIFLMKH